MLRGTKLTVYLRSLRCFSSALYITGDKAHKTFAVLTPYIDFEQQLADKNNLIKNVKARHLDVNVDEVEKKWRFWKELDEQKNTLENNRIKISSSIKELLNDPEKNNPEIEKLKLHSKLIKDDLKNLKDNCYEIEENVMLQILDLPNNLHEKTPKDSETLVFDYLENNGSKSDSHMNIGKTSNLIEYINPMCCYFKSDAAVFEVSILNFFRKSLLNSNFTQFSNPDFVRSVIVEGCGVKFLDNNQILTLQNTHAENNTSRLHLSGGASLFAFMAYFTKHSVSSGHFPWKYFSLGRNFQSLNKNCPKDLFNLNQQSCLNVFVATLEEQCLLDEIVEEVQKIYKQLGYHFRLVFLPAHELENNESLRLSVQMYSNYLQKYVEVGNVSCYDSYISKRLLFNYSVNKERKYPKIIAGTLLNVPKLLGCVLENNFVNNKDLLCNLLKKHTCM